MKIRNAVPQKLSWPPPSSSATNPNLVQWSKWLRNRKPSVRSVFAKTPLPTALFEDPTVSVLRATPRDRLFGARFLLFRNSEATQLCELSPAELAARAFRVKMLNYIQILTTPTADTHGSCLLLHFDNKRYLFGNIAEGTQRALVQRNIGIQRVDNLFLTGLVNWHNHGGLLGVVLVLADTLAGKVESIQANIEERKKKGKSIRQTNEIVKPSLRIHGGKNLAHLLATARRFIFRKGLPLRPHEIRDDPRSTEQQALEPDWQDANIKVWYMPVQSTPNTPTSPRKRTHQEFTEGTKADKQPNASPASSDNEDDIRLVNTIVTQMFDSDWKMDALIETTLHQAKLPAKLFVRDDKGHIQVYTGPMPGGDQEVPDIPVLVRQPWPGAMVAALPHTEPSHQSMCYIVKGHDRRGKFNAQKAENLGVPKWDNKLLTAGQNVVLEDGTVVTPSMVLEETIRGKGFAVVDLPDTSYIDSLVNRTEWSNDSIMNGVHVVFWILGRGVSSDPRLQEFMKNMSKLRHIVSSVDDCPNRISLESVATQSFKLRCIDPDRFPLPTYNNEVSLSGTPTTSTSSLYESGRIGKTVQFAPQYLHQDDKIVPFPDIEKLARDDLNDEVLELAQQARAKITNPEFLAKLEKVESDIPHRDAEIITLGTGSALPSKYRNVSATLARVPGCGNYLFDCGENTLGQLQRTFGDDLPEILRDLKGIWISHLHADHHLGTASVIRAWHEETSKSNPSAKLLVASHAHMINWLEEYADIENYGFERLITTTFHSDAIRRGTRICKSRIFTEKETAALGLKQIDACYVTHCLGALATVFTFPSGLKIAYSGDCRPSDDFVILGKGATLLIHESTFDDELKGDAIAKKHSTMSEAIDVGRRMGARRILLTHFSQRYQKVPILEENLEIRDDAEGDKKAELDEVILVGFDYMRVKLGDFRKAQAFLPALQKLFEDVQDDQ
ncbi:beta-lactamase-like protein [Hypoxylon sp. FL0890]|nr:beta-lactamase-like protein [Hypoxylon sp. FL0890]